MVVFEIIKIFISVVSLICLVYLVYAVQKVLRSSEEFVAEFKAHFDDMFLRRLMKKMGIRQGRNL